MRRAFLFCAAIAFAIACGDDITEPTAERSQTPKVLFATSTSDDGLSISTDKDDYAPGDTVRFTGAGWPANDVLDIVLVDDMQDTHAWTVSTGDDGTFRDSTYVVNEADAGVTFTLTATSRATGASLTVQFTDGTISNATIEMRNSPACAAAQPSGTVNSPICAHSSFTITGNGGTAAQFRWKSPGASGTIVQISQRTPDFPNNTSGPQTYDASFTPTSAGTWTVLLCQSANADPAPGGAPQCQGGSTGTQRASQTFTVNPATTTTELASSLNPSLTTQSVTFTATVKDQNVNPIGNKGSVTFYEFTGSQTCDALGGATSLAGPTTLSANPSGGQASFSRTLTAGTHVITACYGGTPDFLKSFGSVTQTVVPPITATAITLDPATGTYGGQVTLSATLKAGSTALIGKSISFTLNGSAVGSAPTTSPNGAATLTVYLSSDGTNTTGTRINAGSYPTGVGADYAGETGPPAFGSSSKTASLTVGRKTITGNITADNKEYDGTDAATIASRSLNGVEGTDVVSLTGGTAKFDNKNVGNGKTVTAAGLSISGGAADNYLLNPTTATTTANITPKPLTGTITAENKVYDGTRDATITSRTLIGVISPDVVTVSGGTAQFDDKNVGNGKTVTATGLILSGAAAGNYSFPGGATGTANITQKSLTVTASGVERQYDGTRTATVTLSDDRISGDVINTTYTSALFDDKNAGNGKHISVSGISITGGADAGNYDLANNTASSTANITQRPLTVSATGVNKEYDGTTDASVTLSDNRVSGDVLSLAYLTAHFADKHVGNAKPINVGGIAVTGADAGNYTFNTTALATANITQRPITVTAKTDTKEYDGNTSSDEIPEITYGSLATGDVAGFTQAFDNKNAGTHKSLKPDGAVTDGNDGKNYKVTFENNTAGVITPKPLLVTAHGVNKVYDGTINATVTFSDDRIVGDVLTVGYTGATFADKNVGTGKSVSVTGINLTGTDAGNYTPNTTATTTANITARPLTVVASAADKYYDGNTTASVTLSFGQPSPPLAGDNVTISYSSATFDDKNVGSGKTVTVSGLTTGGTDKDNYEPNPPTHTAITTASILAWKLAGFYQPVDMPLQAGGYTVVWNTVKGGSTVPLKFEVFAGATELKDVSFVQPLFTKEVACGVGLTDNIEVTATGGTVLRFDPTGDQFIYNWQTPNKRGYCYQVTMKTADASTLVAYFQLK